ncbi:zf-TFIIB domain-containing protein [Phenylobacterium sp. J367]|uniref:TFIIB-type zinc ribbon-containing protein n=1 Tax=Phenylobacterium sp. J367 TaxID=2898435 RepID=UPI002150D0C6|nr:zf-TFIIB domain-containing protein [Phenylobacterium sp. J367]MCR5880784.1 zf-TFIIB domain-containing protein [Phenylobacterium sp. J367]
MPLLLCPNDNTSMQNVNRNGVEIDICPTCRGVWLDRGELEKILGDVKTESQGQSQDRQRFEREVDQFHRDPDAWKRQHPYDSAHKRYKYDDDYHYRKKKKGFDIFDIFD